MKLYADRVEFNKKELKVINDVKDAVSIDKLNSDRDKKIEEAFNKLYMFFSKYSEKELNSYVFVYEMYKLERLLSDEFVDIDSTPDFDLTSNKEFPERILTSEDSRKAIEYVVFQTRRKLFHTSKSMDNTLEGQCISTNSIVKKICIDQKLKYINFNVSQDLGRGYYHCFSIVKTKPKNFEEINYIVDCTYRQFFTKSKSFIKRIETMRGLAKGESIGTYMLMDEKRKKIAEELLQKGFIVATPENLKCYLDAIVFSGRDKEYYKKNKLNYMNPKDCIPKYSLNDYMDMLIKNKTIKYASIEEAVRDILSSTMITSTEFNNTAIIDLDRKEKEDKHHE